MASGEAQRAGENDYLQKINKAASMLRIGQGARARRLLQQAIDLNSVRPEAYGMLGQALAGEGQLEKSARAYENAIAKGSQERQVFLEAASVYDVSKRYSEAMRIYDVYLATHANDAEFLHQKGLTLLLLKQYAEALVVLREAVAVGTEPSARLDLGYALLRSSAYEEARTLFMGVVKDQAGKPMAAKALEFLAQAEAALGNVARAKQYLDEAIELAPKSASLRRVRATLSRQLGDTDVALGDYNWLVRLSPHDAGARLGRAATYIERKNFIAAGDDVRAARLAVGDHPQVLFRAAQLAWRIKGTKRAHAEALKVVSDLAKKHPRSVELLSELLLLSKITGDTTLHKQTYAKLKTLQSQPK